MVGVISGGACRTGSFCGTLPVSQANSLVAQGASDDRDSVKGVVRLSCLTLKLVAHQSRREIGLPAECKTGQQVPSCFVQVHSAVCAFEQDRRR